MKTAIEIVLGLMQAAPAIAELLESLTGQSKAAIEDRLKRARASIEAPTDTSAHDAARRVELERILRGEG